MPLLDFHLKDIPEQEVVPPGEYTLRCVQAEVRQSRETGRQYLYVLYEIDGYPNSFPVGHVIMFPTENDDELTRIRRLRSLKRFFEAHEIDLDQPDTDLLIGKEVQARLVVEEDEEYGERNRIRRFL